MTDKIKKTQDQDVSLLELLKQKRLEDNIAFDELSSKLKLRVKDLEFIEEAQCEEIAQHPHLSGLIRSYANFLKIDENIVDEGIKTIAFKSNVSNKKYELLNIGENLDLKPNKDQFFNFVFISILLFLIFFILYNFYEDNSRLIDYSGLVIELAK